MMNDLLLVEDNASCLPTVKSKTRLVVSGDPDILSIKLYLKQLEYPINVENTFIIGRSHDANLDLPHEAISRKHCIISHIKGIGEIEVCTRNGLHLNNSHLKQGDKCTLLHSDVLTLSSEFLPTVKVKYFNEDQPTLIKRVLKRKLNSGVETNGSKKVKPNGKENCELQELDEQKFKCRESYRKRLSDAQTNYDSQMSEISLNEATNRVSEEELKTKTNELKAEFLVQKQQIENEYKKQVQRLEAKFQKVIENVEELRGRNEKLMAEKEQLQEKLKKAEELIILGQQELEKENKDKEDILEQVKQLEEGKQEALRKCLEAEAQKDALEDLNVKHQSEMETLYQKHLELERKIAEVKEREQQESENQEIIKQMQEELIAVGELLKTHEYERCNLEEEIRSKVQVFADVLETEAQCTICSEIFVDAVTLLGCFHTFCQSCIVGWMKQKKDCPICRHKIGKNQEKRNFLVDNWIRSFLDKMSPEMKAAREELIKIRSGQVAVGDAASRRPTASSVSRLVLSPARNASIPVSAASANVHFLRIANVSVQVTSANSGEPAIVRVGRTRHARVGASVAPPPVAPPPVAPVILNPDPIVTGAPRPVSSSFILISDEEE